MLTAIQKLTHVLTNNAREVLQSRNSYHSLWDLLKVFGLRLSTTQIGSHYPCFRVLQIRLRGYPIPVRIRPKTTDCYVLRDIFENSEYDFIKTISLRPDDYIIDLGANIGLFSRYAETVFPNSRFLCIDPDHSNLELLTRNCRRMIQEGRLTSIEAFIAAEHGVASIDRTGGTWGYRMKTDPSRAEQIRCVTMPAISKDYDLTSIGLLKCDIEGSERELFANCSPWIQSVDNLIVELHDPYLLEDLIEDLNRAHWHHDISTIRSANSHVVLLRKFACHSIDD